MLVVFFPREGVTGVGGALQIKGNVRYATFVFLNSQIVFVLSYH